MHDVYIGIDNGITGSIGILDTENSTEGSAVYKTPTKSEQSYTKKKQKITRLDFPVFWQLMKRYDAQTVFVLLERPLLNPKRLKASISALRCLEAELAAVEGHYFPYQYVDSKEWQRELLPQGIKGTTELKKASVDIGIRLFPQHKTFIRKHGDADALLMAEWARRKGL